MIIIYIHWTFGKSYMKTIFALLMLGLTLSAWADEENYLLVIQNHQFEPSELVVPANKKIKLQIMNKDVTPEEFDSYELNREKVIAGKSSVIIYVGPLKAGRYSFNGEYNQKTARGILVAQ
jgi:heme/copper-type cytochrome/quinol oxidase subunit 2